MRVKQHNLFLIIPILVFLIIGIPTHSPAKEETFVRYKIGLTRNTTGVDYTYTTERLKSGDTVANSPVEANHLVSLSGNDLYVEAVISKTFGIEYNIGLLSSASEDTFEITTEDDTIRIGDINQSLSNTFSYGVNVYLFNQFKSGANASVGILSGNYQLETKYTNGGKSKISDSRDTTVAGFPENQTSIIDIPVTAIKLSFDLTLKTAGLRLLFFLPFGIGEAKSDELGNTDLNQPQQEIVIITSRFGISGYYYW